MEGIYFLLEILENYSTIMELFMTYLPSVESLKVFGQKTYRRYYYLSTLLGKY